MARWAVAGAVLLGVRVPASGTTTGPGPTRVERLAPDRAWGHCGLAGERRPAAGCVAAELLAAHKGRRIPASGILTIRLGGEHASRGELLVAPEAYVYDVPPPDRVYRFLLKAIGRTQPDTARIERVPFLQDLAEHPAFRRTPLPVQIVSGAVPTTLTMRFADADRGRRVAFVVRAWPLARHTVVLPAVRGGDDRRLALGFGVQDAGMLPGAPPVTFVVLRERDGAPAERLWQRTLDPAADGDRGWQTTEIDLGPHAGETLRLRLVAGTGPDGEAPGLGTWARPLVRRPWDGAPPPSVLLLSIDTLRADHVGAYGARRPTTPMLDRIATAGVLFEQAIAPFPSTTASHMTMLTSTDPCAHRMTLPQGRLSDRITTVAEVLAAQGYATMAVTEDGLIKGEAGFERGFDSYRDLRPSVRPLGVLTDGIALAESWLAVHGDGPFFLFLHTYQVHIPYKVPPQLAGLFPVAPDAGDAARQEAEYDRGLRWADELLGGFLDGLAQRGVLDHTVLVVTADHGTEFGEHGGIGHARGVHVEQLQVPLIVVHPELAAGGRRIPTLVGLIDVAPTIVALAGGTRPESFQGRSLLPLLAAGSIEERPIYAEQLWGPRQTLRRDARWRWIQTTDGTAVYDGRTDPGEHADLAARRPALAARGASAIADYRDACERLRRDLRGDDAAPGPDHDPARVRALRDLGYLE